MMVQDEKIIQNSKLLFKCAFNKDLNLDNPKTLNEKIWRLKLIEQFGKYSEYTDKIKAKETARKIIGDKYIIPTLGIYKNFEDIPFDTFLDIHDKIVVKCNHDSGSTHIIDKNTNIYNLIPLYKNYLSTNHYNRYYESNYRDITPRVLIEPYYDCGVDTYKFFCFDGEVKIISVKENENFTYFDKDFNLLQLQWGNGIHTPLLDKEWIKPTNFDDLIECAKKLSEGFKFVRIDLFNNNNNILFNEFTFYHDAGLCPMYPNEYDEIFGSYLNIV